MSRSFGSRPSIKTLGRIDMRPSLISSGAFVRQSHLESGGHLPLLLQPINNQVNLISWAERNRDFIEACLLKHGAILFRDFYLEGTADFERFIRAASGDLLEYRERSSPRQPVEGHIYTSTEYPADQQIFLHNENSYASGWPMKLFFYCLTPPTEGGQTPIADVRNVYKRLDQSIIRKFEQKQVMYVRNFNDFIGLPWQTVFQTDMREDVEAYARDAGYKLQWKENNCLKTCRVGQASARHPKTGELVWFNHVVFFNVSTMSPKLRDGLLAQFKEEDLPNNTYYGDGSSIEPEVLNEICDAYNREAVSFCWRKGDVLMLDNMLVAHGRMPFKGSRKILVGMSELFDSKNF